MQAVQLTLPIPIEERPSILGVPILKSFFDTHIRNRVEVLGDPYQGRDYVYIVCFLFHALKHAEHYAGSTVDFVRRLKEHKRKYPLFTFDRTVIEILEDRLPGGLGSDLWKLYDRRFRRHHTLLNALVKLWGEETAMQYRFIIMSASKRHNGSPLLMAANRANIPWHVSRVFRCDRKFEQYLKRQKNVKRHCPICQGEALPF